MPITQSLNSKANIKKFTNQDLPFSPQQPVMNSFYAVSTAGQTVINLSFSVDTTASDQFFLFVDGRKLRLGASNDYQFSSVGSNGLTTQVTLTSAIASGQNIQAYLLGLKKESEFNMDNRFVQLYAAQNAGFQDFIDISTVITATTNTGAPVAGKFYSTISNRAPIPDLTQNLRAHFGVDRVQFLSLQLLQNEFGPAGQPVQQLTNDTSGRIRFVGTWGITPDANGTRPTSGSTAFGDYIEITFYGTGLNLMTNLDTGNRGMSYTVDGGSSTVLTSSTGNGIMLGRNTNPNTMITVVNGLALGVHTVTITTTGPVNVAPMGVDIINDAANLMKINPGVGYVQGQKLVSSLQSSLTYNSAVTGTRGGRVLLYQNGDGSIGSAFTPTNTTSLFSTAADHTNEEVARSYFFREFGAGTTISEFSRFTSGNAAFTLEDGTTTLAVQNYTVVAGSAEGLASNTGAGDFLAFTFVGTGLDIVNSRAATNTQPNTVLVDGVAVITATAFGGSGFNNTLKICSGLPYGTHTVKILATAGGASIGISRFIVYQPKKPTLPSGVVEIADYNVMANYDGSTLTGTTVTDFLTPPVGALYKSNMREYFYSGANWTSPSLVVTDPSGWNFGTTTNNGQPAIYTFFGTGFVMMLDASSAGTVDFTVNIDGSLNATGVARSNASNLGAGSYRCTSTTSSQPCRVEFTGLTLGIHTFIVQRSAGTGQFNWAGAHIVVPVHSYKSNVPSDLQNTLPVGNQSLSDNRKLTPVKDVLPAAKGYFQSVGVASSPTITSTSPVPLPDMMGVIKTSGGPLQISFWGNFFTNPSTNAILVVLVDGTQISTTVPSASTTANSLLSLADTLIVPVSAGYHTVQLFWYAGAAATTTANLTQRHLTVREL